MSTTLLFVINSFLAHTTSYLRFTTWVSSIWNLYSCCSKIYRFSPNSLILRVVILKTVSSLRVIPVNPIKPFQNQSLRCDPTNSTWVFALLRQTPYNVVELLNLTSFQFSSVNLVNRSLLSTRVLSPTWFTLASLNTPLGPTLPPHSSLLLPHIVLALFPSRCYQVVNSRHSISYRCHYLDHSKLSLRFTTAQFYHSYNPCNLVRNTLLLNPKALFIILQSFQCSTVSTLQSFKIIRQSPGLILFPEPRS